MQGETKQSFKKGDVLMREGDPGDCAYVIESGNVEILVQRDDTLVQIGTRGAGSILGEMAIIDDKPRTATVRALDDCEALRISRQDFSRRAENADPVLKMVLHVVMTRYRDLIGRSRLLRFPHEEAGHTEQHENMNELHDLALSTLKIHNELKTAIAENQLALFYQPIVDLQKMKIKGFEALMRWQHPEKGLIPPSVFIPVAEESGLIQQMTVWALGEACRSAQKIQKAAGEDITDGDPLFISVNFSVRDFSDGNAHEKIKEILSENGSSAEQIHLEITETLLMEAPEQAKASLEECRKSGINVSIDDFGSGYSSLNYLHYFPIDTLKIDQSFVRAMHTHPASRVLITSIIGIARNLNMCVIAEGIESAEDAKLIRDLGCEQGQGYWFAKPFPLEDALTFVGSWQAPDF